MENFDFGANEPCESCAALRKRISSLKSAGDAMARARSTEAQIIAEGAWNKLAKGGE